MKRLAKYLPALILSLPFTAQAEMVNLVAELSGGAARPTPVVTAATGAASMVLDDVTGNFTWNISFSGLSTPLTVAHFHGPATVDDTASPSLGLFPPEPGGISNIDIAQDGLSGSFLGMFTLADLSVQKILNDLWYINVHSEAFPGGEIRGQVFQAVASPIPLPAALYMFASALGLLAFATRRRAQA